VKRIREAREGRARYNVRVTWFAKRRVNLGKAGSAL